MIYTHTHTHTHTRTHTQLSLNGQAFNRKHSCSGSCYAAKGEAALVSKSQNGSSFLPLHIFVSTSATLAFTRHQHRGKRFHREGA